MVINEDVVVIFIYFPESVRENSALNWSLSIDFAFVTGPLWKFDVPCLRPDKFDRSFARLISPRVQRSVAGILIWLVSKISVFCNILVQ